MGTVDEDSKPGTLGKNGRRMLRVGENKLHRSQPMGVSFGGAIAEGCSDCLGADFPRVMKVSTVESGGTRSDCLDAADVSSSKYNAPVCQRHLSLVRVLTRPASTRGREKATLVSSFFTLPRLLHTIGNSTSPAGLSQRATRTLGMRAGTLLLPTVTMSSGSLWGRWWSKKWRRDFSGHQARDRKQPNLYRRLSRTRGRETQYTKLMG